MISKFHRVLDPLDVEILERAVDQAWAALKEDGTAIESNCDQALEAALHRELIIAREKLAGAGTGMVRSGPIGAFFGGPGAGWAG